MLNTTLCYIEKDGFYLMLHRTKKKNDVNHDKWVGIGGKFEEGESPEDCLLREVKEEVGITLLSYTYRGIITFVSDKYPTEYMHLFTASDFVGEVLPCDEGEPVWVEKSKIASLPIWEGDKIFFRLLNENAPFFSLKLKYEGEHLKEAILNGEKIKKLP